VCASRAEAALALEATAMDLVPLIVRGRASLQLRNRAQRGRARREPWRRPIASNFGNPEKPEVMWQLAAPSTASPAACADSKFPSPAANVSFIRDGSALIDPTPCSAFGMIEDASRALGMGVPREGQ